MKKCWSCSKELSEDCFFKDRSKTDGLDGRCKSCSKVRKYRNGGSYKSPKRIAINEAKSKPCTDCNLKYPPYVMEFDHIPGKGEKIADISRMAFDYGLSLIQEEIKKCELVCANCHRERTYKRQQAAREARKLP